MLSDDGTTDSYEAFELCLSVWSLIQSQCPEKEVAEVRRLLGASLIEQTADLREEVCTLLEIWRQLRDEDSAPPPSRQLSEPPEVRQRLIQEIAFFVDYLQKKAKGHLIEQDRNRDILHYVENEASKSGSGRSSRCESCVSVESGGGSCGSRPHSAISSRDGRETPLRPLTPKSQNGSQTSVLTEKSHCVNAMDIDSVVEHLRQALRDECEQHQRDIEFLQRCLEGDQESSGGVHTEPTIRELRNLGTQLERAVLEDTQPTLPPVPKPTKLPPLQPRPPSTPHTGSLPSRAPRVRRDFKHSLRKSSTEKQHPVEDIPNKNSPFSTDRSVTSVETKEHPSTSLPVKGKDMPKDSTHRSIHSLTPLLPVHRPEQPDSLHHMCTTLTDMTSKLSCSQ